MKNITTADLTALITALAGLATAVAAVLHSIHTKNTVQPRAEQAAQDFLTSDDTRAALGRQVRSTAKDALQDLTEAAGQPFVIPPAEPTSSAPSMMPGPGMKYRPPTPSYPAGQLVEDDRSEQAAINQQAAEGREV